MTVLTKRLGKALPTAGSAAVVAVWVAVLLPPAFGGVLPTFAGYITVLFGISAFLVGPWFVAARVLHFKLSPVRGLLLMSVWLMIADATLPHGSSLIGRAMARLLQSMFGEAALLVGFLCTLAAAYLLQERDAPNTRKFPNQKTGPGASEVPSPTNADVVSALVNLGYSRTAADGAVRSVPAGQSLEFDVVLKKCLQILSGGRITT